MKKLLFLSLVACILFVEVQSQSACPGLKNPISFATSPNYSGQTGTRQGGVSTYNNIFLVMQSATINSAALASTVSTSYAGSCDHVQNGDLNRFVIKSAGTDPYTSNRLSYLPPDTSFFKSIRLGNCGGDAEAEALYYTMQVTPQNALVFINYAIVLYNSLHDAANNPEFIIRVRKKVGSNFVNISDTLCYIVQSPVSSVGSITPFYNINLGTQVGQSYNQSPAIYKPWAKVAINLNNYLYETIRIEMMVGDCGYSAHYGYCYITGDCQPMMLNANDCAAGASEEVAIIRAPKGLNSYQWQRKDAVGNWIDIPGATDSVLRVLSTHFYQQNDGSRVPSNGFRCKMTSTLDPSKPITSYLETIVNNKKPAISMDVESLCDGTMIFTNRSVAPFSPTPADEVDTSNTIWNFGDGSPTKRGGKVTHQYSAPGNYEVTLLSTAFNPTCYAEKNIPVYVKHKPSIEIVADDTIRICSGKRLNFSAFSTESLSGHRWVIHKQDGSTDTVAENDEFMSYVFQDTSIVELRAFNADGCDTVVYKTIYAEAYAELVVTGDTIVCNGTQSVINVSSNMPNCTYGWYMNPQSTTPFQTGTTLVRTPTQNETYYVQVTTPNGCKSWDSLSIRLISPTLTSSKTRICAKESVTLTAGNAVYYRWTSTPEDPSLLGQEGNTEIEVYPLETTTYKMIGYGQNDCAASALTKTITVYPYPIPRIDYTPHFIDSEDPKITFKDISEGSVSSKWNFGDGKTSTERSVIHEFKDMNIDSAYVSLKTANDLGCSSDTTIAIPVCVFSVWYPTAFSPDKSSNNLFKVFTTNDIRDYMIHIYDRNGLEVFTTQDRQSGWDGTYKGHNCKQGIYVWVSSYRRVETDKVIQRKGTVLLIR